VAARPACAATRQVSEEDDEPTVVDAARRGDYCVVFDPLVPRPAPRPAAQHGLA